MVEVERHDNTRAIAGTGLGFGIGAAALSLLQNGNLGGILGGGNGYTRVEAEKDSRIAALETEVKLRDSNIYTDSKILELYRYVDGKFGCVEAQINQQAVVNTQVAANLSCLQNTVNVLSGLTKTIIPIDNICPPPMERYNSWTAPTTTGTTT